MFVFDDFPKPAIIRPIEKKLLVASCLPGWFPSGAAIYAPPEFRLLQAPYWSTTDSSSYTDSGVDLGAPDASRLIVVSISSRHNNSGQQLSGVTVGGNSLTIDVQRNNSGNSANGLVAICSGTIPAGTSGDVVASFSGTVQCCLMGTYRAANLASNALYDIDPDTDVADPTMNINVPANGIIFAAAAIVSGGSSVTWTGITEDADYSETWANSIASAGILPQEAARAVSCNGPGVPSRYCCASYG